jgi:hypothetical protein
MADSVSVVIAWVNALDYLIPGLESLKRQVGNKPNEIIIATRHSTEQQQKLMDLFPEVDLIPAPQGTPITKLRSLALRKAEGSLVAVTEDHCIPGREWITTIEKRMSGGEFDLVGGPVENAYQARLRDWAAFLTEYASFIPGTSRDGNSQAIPGNNVAYSRKLIGELCTTLDQGLWENFYLQTVMKDGIRQVYDPDMVIYHYRPFDFGYFMKQRYFFSRSYAAMRRGNLSSSRRLMYGMGSLILPALLPLRGLATLKRKGRYLGMYLTCLPLILNYVSSGMIGEMAGYLFGAGNSLSKVE